MAPFTRATRFDGEVNAKTKVPLGQALALGVATVGVVLWLTTMQTQIAVQGSEIKAIKESVQKIDKNVDQLLLRKP